MNKSSDELAAMPAVEVNQPVVDDASCKRCGYNLRGLPLAGRCPECALAVGVSVRGSFLRFADPAWVLTLRRGVNFILLGVLALIVSVVVVAVTGPRRGDAMQLLLSFGGSLLMMVGAWQLTEPDPSGLGETDYGTSRRIIRVALGVNLLSYGLRFLMVNDAMPPDIRAAVTAVLGLCSILALVGQFAQLRYLSKLALRIPDEKLSRRARIIMWAISICYGGLVCVGLLAALSRGSAIKLIAVLSIPLGLGLLVFGILYLLMLEKFGKQFKAQAAIARQTWAGAAARDGIVPV